MHCLLLVDIQIDFLPGGALAVPRGDEVVPLANALQPHFGLIVATQDWHPADHASFASQYAGRHVGEVVELDGLPQVLWPDHCVQEMTGANFAQGLHTGSIARVFQKGTDCRIDSYSGFFDNGQRKSTGLADYLHARRVSEVFILGLATDYCVKATALDAARLGFRTSVIEDACRGVELQPGDIDRAWQEMQQAGIERVLSSHWISPEIAKVRRQRQQEVLYEGRFLKAVRSHGWEYVERTNVSGVVGIVALTDQHEVLIVEQYREPIQRRCLELPAGLAGDEPGQAGEPLANAVHRELLEETGYTAREVVWLGQGQASAGLANEAMDLFLATGLSQASAGGGVGGEEIILHRVPWGSIHNWLAERQTQGYSIATSLYAGLWLASRRMP